MLVQTIYTTEQLVAAGSILLLLLLIIVWVVRGATDEASTEFFDRKDLRPATPAPSQKAEAPLRPDVEAVRVLRGGAFVGNRMRFKAKVVNESEYTITDVTVHLVSYPRDALLLDGRDDDVRFGKIEPGAFRSPSFEFIPTQDCVKGEIVAGVTYVDYRGKAHSLTTRPYTIRAVCDLLIPDDITPEDFRIALQGFHSGDVVVSVEEWTPRKMFEMAGQILTESNFSTVRSHFEVSDGFAEGKIEGWARGKYTGKQLGVELIIGGPQNEGGASCTVKVSGEDGAMVVPALEDLRSRLCSWLCPQCRSALSADQVTVLRRGGVIDCSYCGTSIGR